MTFDDIVMEHTNILADYGFKLGVDNQQIPVLYWTAKLHKKKPINLDLLLDQCILH